MSMTTTRLQALTFGSLNLIGTQAEYQSQGYTFEALGDDADWGNPVPIEEKVISWLQDGALVALKGYDNREIFIRVRIRASDLNKLAQAESLLMLESGKTNLLTWTPPDGVGAPTVFSVVMSHLEEVTDDLADLRREATYGLRVQAESFPRSSALSTLTVPAPTGTQTFTTVDDCTSFTGWAAAAQGGGTATSGTVGGSVFLNLVTGANAAPYGGNRQLTLTRTGLSISLAATPYLRIRLTTKTSSGYFPYTPIFVINGVRTGTAIQEGSVYWVDTSSLGVGTLNSVAVETTAYNTTPGSTVRLEIADITRSNFLGTQSTNRQLARTLAVAGSARTQGSLALSDPTNALGTTLIYTCPSVPGLLQPNLRTLLATGNTPTGEILSVSGFNSDLTTLHGFDVPEVNLEPGGYLLLARVRHASTGAKTIAWAARSRMGSTNLPDAQTGTTTINVPVAATYAVYTVASLNLPPRKIGDSGVVRIEMTSSGLILDEAWLFNIESGRLTWVECGTATAAVGGPAKNLFLDAANVDTPVPTVWLGHSTDRSDQYHASSEMFSFGNHEFVPPSMNVFTVTSNSQAAAVTLSHYPRYHTRVVA